MGECSARLREPASREFFRSRSFVVACTPSREEQRTLEREIEARGGSVHPFLNSLTDVLVVGPVVGNESGALWVREQVRRGEAYRARWGALEFVSEAQLRAALAAEPPVPG